MIHIVFNNADVDILQRAIELDPYLSGEIIEIKDDYAVGPIDSLNTANGRNKRNEWWQEVLSGGDYDGLVEKGFVDDDQTFTQLLEMLDENNEEILWIWAAQNKHDVSGYYWIISQLHAYVGRVYILYLNNLPFINEKGSIFYPEWLHLIPPKEFLKAKKLARPVTPSEFEVDPDEWKRLGSESKHVRILEGGKKLAQFDEDFYDQDLLKFITKDWQKGSKVISHFLSKNKHTTGDAYLLWRLKKLISNGHFDIQGEVRAMKDFEIKWSLKESEIISQDQ